MGKMPNSHWIRAWLVRWLYLVGGVHLVVAIVMTWCADLPLFHTYHQQTVTGLGFTAGDLLATCFQHWWFQLFGATLQAFSIVLLILVNCGDRQRSPLLWSLLTITLLYWAPQDMYISMQKNMWSHFWMDLLALTVLVPPLVMLAFIDRKSRKSSLIRN